MYLRRNFSFNQKNITRFTNKALNKPYNNTSKKKSTIIRLKNNYNKTNPKQINNNQNLEEDDLSFYENIKTLKNQIFSPENNNNEDIYLYNNNKKMEKKINYEDEKNINNNFLTSRTLKNIRSVNKTKKTLILDLDETLVHSLFQPEKTNNNIIEPDIYLKIFFNNKYQEIFVYKRPFLDFFLKEMKKDYNIYVFTASIEKYAKPLLDKLDKNNLIQKKFYRESCLLSEGKYIKDLNSLKLNLELKDVIIIDNNPFSYKFNKNNGIPIKSWHWDKSDAELIKIIPLLKFLAKIDDVRKYIPNIITNNEINFEKVNLMINNYNNNNRQERKIYKTINYNNYNNNEYNFKKNNPETINFLEPQTNNKIKLGNKNFNNRNHIEINPYMQYKNNINDNNHYRNNSIGINFNSREINNFSNSKNIEKFFKSYNNFYIKTKYSFLINQDKENEKNNFGFNKRNMSNNKLNNNKNLESQKSYEDYEILNNLFNKYKTNKLKKKKRIPIAKRGLNKENNKTTRIYKEYKTDNENNYFINDNKNIIRHCSSYKIFNDKENININSYNNTIKPLTKINDYVRLKKNTNNIETSLKYENNKQKSERFYNNNKINLEKYSNNKAIKKEKNIFPKKKIKLKNLILRNKVKNFNQNIKSYSYSNLNGEN